MLTIVVMPCRNEEANLIPTCGSLGFDTGRTYPAVHLVLVDNGSDDGTWDVMSTVRERSAPGSVTCVREPVRGHVPARVRGVEAARAVAANLGVGEDDVLLVQADADTCYGPGYLMQMVDAAHVAGPGCLLEGRSVPPGPGADGCAAFRALEGEVDDALAPLLSSDEALDAIVDDKVAAFRLVDYLRWGGHLREHTRDGHEILAETTRLWLRARTMGARRRHVDDATAVTSSRRILADPALAFATGGFPRDAGWVTAWQRAYPGPRSLSAFQPGEEARVEVAVRARTVHLLAMFRVLPDGLKARDVDATAAVGTDRSAATSGMSPGELLEHAFDEAEALASDLMRVRHTNA